MPEVRRLPVFRTIDDAYLESIRHSGYFLRLTWAAIALTTIALTLVNAAIVTLFPSVGGNSWGIGDSLLGLAQVFVPLPLVASTAVAWHRLLIDGQRVTGGSRVGFGPVERRYAGAALVLLGYMLVPLLMVVCVQLAVRDKIKVFEDTPVAYAALGFVLVGQIVAWRLSLWLPAIALDRDGASAAWAWAAARKNTWRMCLGFMACWLPAAALLSLIPDGTKIGGGLLAVAAAQAVHTVLSAVVLFLPSLSFLSLAYKRLVLGRGVEVIPRPPPP